MQILGGKTGYNDTARYCLVIAARVDGRNYGMALLGTEGKLTRFGDVARLIDWLVTHKAKLTTPSMVQGPPIPDGLAAQERVVSRQIRAPCQQSWHSCQLDWHTTPATPCYFDN